MGRSPTGKISSIFPPLQNSFQTHVIALRKKEKISIKNQKLHSPQQQPMGWLRDKEYLQIADLKATVHAGVRVHLHFGKY